MYILLLVVNVLKCLLLDGNADDPDVIIGFVCLGVGFAVANILADFHTLNNSSEHSVLVIKPGLKYTNVDMNN